MFSFRRFKAVAQKEFLELKRNKLFFLMTVLAPLTLYFLFAYGFPLDVKNIPMGVADFEKSALSRNLLDVFQNSGVFRIKKVSSNYAGLEKELGLGKIRAILVVPENFSRNLKKGMPAALQILVDGSYPNHANLVGGYAEAALAAFRMDVLEGYFLKTLGYPGAPNLAVDLNVSVWYNPSFRSEDFTIPGVIAIVMMFFPPLISAISIAREKETGSILNMYCSSVSKAEYLLGKTAPYIAISYLNLLIFLALTITLFKVPMRGEPLLLLSISLLYAATATAIGLLVAVFVNTQIAAIIITSVATLTPSFLYSGFMVPVSSISKDARYIAYSLPATHYIDAIRKIMVKGAAFAQVKISVFALVGFSLALYLVSIKFFKKRLD